MSFTCATIITRDELRCPAENDDHEFRMADHGLYFGPPSLRSHFNLGLKMTVENCPGGAPAMLISVQATETATVNPVLPAVWILLAFLAWGAILGRIGQ